MKEYLKPNSAPRRIPDHQKNLSPAQKKQDRQEYLNEIKKPRFDEDWGNEEMRAYSTKGGKKPKKGNPDISKKHQKTKFGKIAYKTFKGPVSSKGSGDSHAFDFNDIEQGYLGDCWFLAAIGAIAIADPSALQSLIKDNGDGTYDVTLYEKDGFLDFNRDPKVITVTGEFPAYATGRSAGQPAYAKAGDKGELWVMLLEKAYAQSKGAYKKTEGGFFKNRFGNATLGMEILTGKDAKSRNLKFMKKTNILTEIETALKNNDPITANTRLIKTKEFKNLGLVNKHVYVITAVDVIKQTVSLYNPWGAGASGSGYQISFTLSIDDFKKQFFFMQILK